MHRIFETPADGRAVAGVAADDGERRRVDCLQSLQPLGRERVAGDVGDMAGEITDLAIGIDHAGLFLAERAVTNEFHDVLSGW